MKPLLTALLLVLLGAPAAFAADLGYPLDAPAPDGLVDNRFENIDQILEKEAANAARKP